MLFCKLVQRYICAGDLVGVGRYLVGLDILGRLFGMELRSEQGRRRGVRVIFALSGAALTVDMWSGRCGGLLDLWKRKS